MKKLQLKNVTRWLVGIMRSNNLKKSVKRNKRVLNRAKLFLSYDALKGFKERIHEKERIIVEKPVLLEDQLYELDWKIKQIKVGMMINIIYFDNDQYIYKKGVVTDIEFDYKKTIRLVDTDIKIKNILVINID